MACTGSSPTWTSTPDYSSVNTCVGNASDGDTIQISNGSATWSSTLTINKALNITAVNPCTLDGNGLPTSCNVTITDGQSDNTSLIAWTPTAGYASSFSHVTFENGRTGTFQSTTAGIINIVGNMSNASSTFRWHHTILNQLKKVAFGFDTVRGVVDHNRVTLGGFGYYLSYGLGRYWSGSYDGMGHYSYHAMSSSKFGSADALYFEDNEVYHVADGAYASLDSHLGFRGVYRFNKFKGVEPEAHGTDTGGGRGTVAIENYCNIYDWWPGGIPIFPALQSIQGFRSGSGMVWGNDIINREQGYGTAKTINAPIDRTAFGTDFGMTFGACDGTSQWDVNDGGNPHFTSSSALTGGTLEVTHNTNPGWTDDEWIGYLIKKTSGGGGHSIIVDNDNNTIFYNGTEGHGTALSFSSGDTFTINKVTEAMDQPGRSGGALQSGTDWTTMTPAGGFNNQIDLPVVEWDNAEVAGGYYVHSNYHATSRTIFRENEHFYNWDPTATTSGTNQTVGVRSGSLENRPGTCTEGVFYVATDQGSWRTATPLTGHTDQGILYRCGASNSWSTYYTPYTYPHPLVTGEVPVTPTPPPTVRKTRFGWYKKGRR